MRIAIPQTIEDSSEASRPLLEAVAAKFGAVPNVFRLAGLSPAVLKGLLDLSGDLAGGILSQATRERISLAVANVNGCDYCNAAHTFGAKRAGLDGAEIEAARLGTAGDADEAVAVGFARKVALARGEVTPEDIEAVRQAGWSDGEIVEIVANVGLNVLTNYLNEVFKTPVDFPAATPATRAA